MNMANYMEKEAHVAGLSAQLASYYGYKLTTDDGIATSGIPMPGMDASIANLLGVDPTKQLTTLEMAHILSGQRADGLDIPGKQQQTKNKIRIAYVDFTLSAPKSFSIAMALAPTEAERARLDKCWTDAVDSTMDIIAKTVGKVSKGKGNSANFIREAAHVAVFKFEHNTARPVEIIAGYENGIPVSTFHPVGGLVADMNRHTHCIMPAVAITDDGRVGSIHQNGIKQRVHEWGAISQAFLATNLRNIGVDVGLDKRIDIQFNDRMAKLYAIPDRINNLFSKRSEKGREEARKYAASKGLDYDTLTPAAKAKLLDGSIKETKLDKSKDATADIKTWKAEAEAAGYHHRSVLRSDHKHEIRPRGERIEAAYNEALPLLESQWTKSAVIKGSVARTAAAKALIEAGIESASDVNAVTSAFRTEGVIQDGKKTDIHWGFDPAEHYARITTQLSVDQEAEAIRILRIASEDKSTALAPDAVQRAVDKVSAEGFDFSTGHGLKQREVIDKLAASGRAAVAVGVAGSGKSTLLRPLIEAWHADGRNIYGVTLGWRQTAGLRDAGIGRKKRPVPDKGTLIAAGVDEQKTFALTPFLLRLETGNLKLDRSSVVVIDEIALVGTSAILRLARLQEKQGFQIVGIGDDKQGQSIDAGNTVDLARRAFGAENVPELISTIRQNKDRDKETSLMFRDGNAKEALARKDEDGQIKIVAGGYEEAVRATVDLWFERRNANADREGYTLGISVPTNADGLAIGNEIRRRRLELKEIEPTVAWMDATDQSGTAKYKLELSVGDRVRLFDRTFGKDAENHYGFVGNNGSVVEVAGVDERRLMVRSATGKIVAVEWEDLRAGGDRIRLARGDAVTIDARQSETLTEHITSMPSGSAAVNGFKAYVAESRQREASYIVTSQGHERMEIEQRRAIGDPRNDDTDPVKMHDAIMANMARNLSRQPEKTLATDFKERAINLRSGAIDSMQAAWFRQESRQEEDKPPLAVEARKEAVALRVANIVSEIIIEEDWRKSLPQEPPTPEETAIARYAALIAGDRMVYSEALDALLSRYIRKDGDIDKIDAVEDRYSKMLAEAAGVAVEGGTRAEIQAAIEKVKQDAGWMKAESISRDDVHRHNEAQNYTHTQGV